ncbi:MAG: hemolysin III family protein [Pirellulales bacterium]
MNRVAQLNVESSTWQRSAADERLNAATHGLGLLLAVVGALLMAVSVLERRDTWRAIGCGVYLASLITVYAMSTLSHSAKSPRWKSLFRRLDQAFIYLLIAATYTPFSLAYLRSAGWWALLGAIWTVAVVGFVSKLFFAHRIEAVSIASYVLLGWMPIVAAPSLMQTLPLGAFVWMLLGGACYTIGTLFLHYDERVRHFHAVWHVCVIAGSACHFLGILIFVVGGAG